MALNEQEIELVKKLKKEGKTNTEIAGAIGGIRTGQPSSISIQEPKKVEGFNLTDVSKGAAKGFLSSALGTAKLFERGGQAIMAGLDPNRTYSQVKEQTGIAAFKGQTEKDINNTLEAKNKSQELGKTLEFVAEILYPAGKTKVGRNVLNEGKKILGASFDNIGSKLSTLPDDAIEGGVKVKDKIGDLLVNLDQKTKTALDRTPVEKFQEVVEQGKKALVDDRNRTPLESVGDDIIEALSEIKKKSTEVGAKKSEFLKYPDAFNGDGVKKFKEGVQSFLNSRTMIENDKPIVRKIVDEFKKLGKTPSKGQVDKFIDYAQEALYSGEKNLVQTTSNKTVSQLRGLISALNNNLKNQLPEGYKQANDTYSRLARLSSELNIKLGKEGGSAGSFVKRLFSPSDARTKELFDELEKVTGRDFSRDARLAKFVMEALGDTRASTLLDLPTNIRGVAGKIMDYGVKKISDPLKAAERYIKK